MKRPAARLLTHGHPLAGASVIVTRPSPSAGPLCRRVRAFGAACIVVPGFGLRAAADIESARTSLRAAQSADVVVFTSPAAVRFAWTLLPRLRLARTITVLAPGAGSARALHRRGVAQATFPPQRQDSEGLLDLLPLQSLRRKHVAIVGAPGGRDLLPAALRARGARVVRVDVYRRVPPRLTCRHLDALRQAAAPRISLFSSAEALNHLQRLLPVDLFALLAVADCVVSSARLGAAAGELGFARVHIAAGPAPAQLLAAAVAVLARHRL